MNLAINRRANEERSSHQCFQQHVPFPLRNPRAIAARDQVPRRCAKHPLKPGCSRSVPSWSSCKLHASGSACGGASVFSPTRKGRRMRIVIAAAVAAVLCTSTAQAQMLAPKKTLYERLGGLPAITAVVEAFVGNVSRGQRSTGLFTHYNV